MTFDANRSNAPPGPQSGPSGLRPHAFDPLLHPEFFEGVLARRIVAFAIDLVIITVPTLFVTLFIFLFGIVTLGLGWALFWLLTPAAILWALAYYAMTLGSPASATLGMRLVDLEMRTWYGAPCYSVLGAVHAIGYWLSVSTLTPLIVLVCFFNDRRRLLHDMLLGTIVVNAPTRAAALRGPP